MSIKETVPFNFDEIYAYIEAKFQAQGYDTQEGSNTMQLVSAMSYLTSMLNVNTAVNINETLLPQATKRNMILQDARVLGYEIEHRQSYKYNFLLQFSNVGTYAIDRYAEFESGEKKYYYMGGNIPNFEVTSTDASTTKYVSTNMPKAVGGNYGGIWSNELQMVTFVDGFQQSSIELDGYDFIEYTGVLKRIEVWEGILHKFSDNTDLRTVFSESNVIGTDNYVDIPFTNIEENGLDVFMTYIDETGQQFLQELWSKSTSFMIDKDTDLTKKYVRLDNIDFSTPRIYFKFGSVGKDVRFGTIIEVNALESSASEGAVTSPPASVLLPCDVIHYSLEVQGADEETNSSIRKNAPLFHNTANRIITKQDYTSFCNRQASVKSSQIWDGNDEYPTRAGHIWFSFLPSTNTREIISTNAATNDVYQLQEPEDLINWYIEDIEIESVWSFLDEFKVPTLQFHNRHPLYFNFNYKVNVVKYAANIAKKNQHQRIFDVIDGYFSEEGGVENFNFEYLNSNLIRRIDTTLTDATGLNIELNTDISLNDKHIISEEFDPYALPPGEYFGNPFSLVSTLTTDDLETLSSFGASVAVSGNRLVIGSQGELNILGMNNEGGNGGVVYIYDWDGTQYIHIASITPNDIRSNDAFGSSVAIYGNRLIVGSPLKDIIDNDNNGKVYVYDWNGNEYILTYELTVPVSIGIQNEWFGASVALNDNRLAVGVPFNDSGATDSGKVMVFDWDGTDYVLTSTIISPEPSIGAMFGSAIAINEQRLLVGAPGVNSNTGKVYVYYWNGSTYINNDIIIASDAEINDRYGSSIAIDDNTLLIGAWTKNSVFNGAGKVYFYRLVDGLYKDIGTITSNTPIENGGFGRGIAISGERLIVSSVDFNIQPSSNIIQSVSGKVFAYNDVQQNVINIQDIINSIDYNDVQTITLSNNAEIIMSIDNGVLVIRTENTIYVYEWNGSQYEEIQQISI